MFEKIGLWYRGLTWLRQQLILIGIVVSASWAITFVGLILATRSELIDFPDFLGDVLLAWTGELLFFTVVGGIVTAISFKDPRGAEFAEREKILFGSGDVPECVLTYHRQVFARLAGYVSMADRKIFIEDYDQKTNAYKVRVKTTYNYKNALPDMPYDDKITLRVTPDEFEASAPAEMGRVLYVTMNGEEKIQKPIVMDKEGFQTELQLQLPPGGDTSIVLDYSLWMKAGVPQTMHPARIVQVFEMSIVNQTEHDLKVHDATKNEHISALYGQPLKFNAANSVMPGTKIFEFVLLPPS